MHTQSTRIGRRQCIRRGWHIRLQRQVYRLRLWPIHSWRHLHSLYSAPLLHWSNIAWRLAEHPLHDGRSLFWLLHTCYIRRVGGWRCSRRIHAIAIHLHVAFLGKRGCASLGKSGCTSLGKSWRREAKRRLAPSQNVKQNERVRNTLYVLVSVIHKMKNKGSYRSSKYIVWSLFWD